MWHGACSPIQGFSSPRPQPSGTVITHTLEHNTSAKNGTWNAYQLINSKSKLVSAWFVCHADVNPETEIDKILRVSGSPYEPDSGSSRNDGKTEAEGVLVINRYDWAYYDERAADVIEPGGWPNCVGLADYTSAKEDINEWKELESHERTPRSGAVWLHIPDAEYNFGRFGFDDSHEEAQSFIFFTSATDFTSTSFAGLEKTLRKFETLVERFERMLREGANFEGLEWLAERQAQAVEYPRYATPVPLESERIGPFEDPAELFLATDFEAIGASKNALGFAEPWKEVSCTLLNEMLMSYLAQYVVPTVSCGTVRQAADAVFPKRSRENTVDHYLHRLWISPWSNPTPNLDTASLGNRVKEFLISYHGDDGLIADSRYIAGVAKGIEWLVGEVLELSSNGAKDGGRNKIVPSDIRIAVYNDEELLTLFGYSKVFWSGNGQGV